jgi:hypothetical protein
VKVLLIRKPYFLYIWSRRRLKIKEIETSRQYIELIIPLLVLCKARRQKLKKIISSIVMIVKKIKVIIVVVAEKNKEMMVR